MENFFRTYGWALRLGVIALASLLVASIVNAGISSQLAPYTVPPVQDLKASKDGGSKTNRTKRPRKPRAKDRVLAISKRCLFGCKEEENKTPTCPADGCPEGQECREGACVPTEAAADPGVASDAPVPSDLAVKLVGAMVSDPSSYSTALFQDASSQQTYVVSLGEALMGEHEVVEVRRDRVIFKRNGRLEFIKLEGATTGDPRGTRRPLTAAVSPPLSAPPRKKSPIKLPKVGNMDGVKAVSSNQYTVAREMITSRLQDKKALAKGATIVPNYKKGKKNGLKLIGVKSDSVYKSLGMKSGDVLQSVNGTTIKSQSHALGLMEKFEDAKNVNIVIERGGVRKTLKYNIK